MVSGTGSVGQSSVQPKAPIQGLGRSTMRSSFSFWSKAGSFGTQGVQRPQRTQTRIFAMTSGEAQANLDTVIGIIFFWYTCTSFIWYWSNRSFVSTAFALHENRELVLLKNKLIVNTLLEEQILRTSIFKGCKIVVKGIVLKANLILLEMSNFDVILRMG